MADVDPPYRLDPLQTIIGTHFRKKKKKDGPGPGKGHDPGPGDNTPDPPGTGIPGPEGEGCSCVDQVITCLCPGLPVCFLANARVTGWTCIYWIGCCGPPPYTFGSCCYLDCVCFDGCTNCSSAPGWKINTGQLFSR